MTECNDRKTGMASWKERYDRMKAHYGFTDTDIAGITGHTPTSVRQMVNSKARDFPRWLRLAIVIFEKEAGSV